MQPTTQGEFISWLKAERERRDLTQRDLGELAGLHHTTISQVERGDREATAEFVISVAQAFDLTPKETIHRLWEIQAWKKPIIIGDEDDLWWIAELKREVRGLPKDRIRLAVDVFKQICRSERENLSAKRQN